MSNSRRERRRLPLLAAASIAFLATFAWQLEAHGQQPLLAHGALVVTGFSGVAAPTPAPVGGDPVDTTFIDPAGAVMRILDVSNPGQPPQAQVLDAPPSFQVAAGVAGQVFGVALDDGKGPDGAGSGPPSIYLAATSVYGLQIVVPDAGGQPKRVKIGEPTAQWMAGQWGAAGGGPGSIWKVDGATGAVTLFANVMQDGLPNSGAGLGNIAFDARTRQLFASDLSTGMIHRFDMKGDDLGFYDHGAQARAAAGLAPAPYDPTNRLDISQPGFNVADPATWGYAPPPRMVFAVQARSDRLYYAVAEGPQIWSVAIGEDGSFGGDTRLEIDIKGVAGDAAIASIAFDQDGAIYLAQRGAQRGDFAYKSFAAAKTSAVLRLSPGPDGKWLPTPQDYAIGFPPDNRNANGGVALGYSYDPAGKMRAGACGGFVWSTGEALRQGAGLPGPENLHGLQGMSRDLVRPANQPPSQSYFVAFDPKMADADAAGHVGAVVAYQPCEAQPPASAPQLNILPAPQPEIAPAPAPDMESIPEPMPPPNFPPPSPGQPGSNLKIAKTGSACTKNGVATWECAFVVTISNTSNTPFAGPVTLDDTTTLGAVLVAPPWTCTNAAPVGNDKHTCTNSNVSIGPHASVSVKMKVAFSQSATTLCKEDNTVKIIAPAGGSLANVDPTDDTATATAAVANPLCGPLKPPKSPTNLKIVKSGAPCDKNNTNQTWECPFAVSIINTGAADFQGPIVLNEDAAVTGPGSYVITAPVPWGCVAQGGSNVQVCSNPSVKIPAMSKVNFDLKVVFKQEIANICAVHNKITLVDPPGGSPSNSNAGDDVGSAVDAVFNKGCAPPSNLSITKEALTPSCIKNNAGNFTCIYAIFLHNAGPNTVNQVFEIDDAFAPFVSFAASGVPFNWTCSVKAAGGLACDTIGQVALLSGGSLELILNFEVPASSATPGKCKLPNTATIANPVGGSGDNLNPNDDTATATAKIPMVVDPVKGSVPCDPPSLTLTKIADPQTCVKTAGGFECSYKVSVASDGPDPFHGDLGIQETLPPGSSVAKVSNGWTCTPSGPAVLCKHAFVDIPVGQSLDMAITLFVPDANVKPGACAIANQAALAPDLGPQQGKRYVASAAATIDSPLCRQPAQQCPGDLRLEGAQCKCPEHTTRTADNRCVGEAPAASQCAPPTIGVYPNCALPACPPGTRGVYPDCVAIGSRCPPDTQGVYPNCARIFARQCPPRTHGLYPNCAADAPLICPPGTQGVYPNCAAIVVRQCPPHTHGLYPNCAADAPRFCPAGTRGVYPNCGPIVVRQCPPHTHGVYPDCASNAAPQVCPAGTQGVYPNCARVFMRQCLPRSHGVYPNCAADAPAGSMQTQTKGPFERRRPFVQ